MKKFKVFLAEKNVLFILCLRCFSCIFSLTQRTKLTVGSVATKVHCTPVGGTLITLCYSPGDVKSVRAIYCGMKPMRIADRMKKMYKRFHVFV